MYLPTNTFVCVFVKVFCELQDKSRCGRDVPYLGTSHHVMAVSNSSRYIEISTYSHWKLNGMEKQQRTHVMHSMCMTHLPTHLPHLPILASHPSTSLSVYLIKQCVYIYSQAVE